MWRDKWKVGKQNERKTREKQDDRMRISVKGLERNGDKKIREVRRGLG